MRSFCHCIALIALIVSIMISMPRLTISLFNKRCSRHNLRSPGMIKPINSFLPVKIPMTNGLVRHYVLSTKLFKDPSLGPPTPIPTASEPNAADEPRGIKILWSKYGWIAVGTYLSIYVTTLGSLFVSLDYDLFNASTFGFDPNEAITKFCNIVETFTGYTTLPGYIRQNPKVGTFAIAWVMTKFTEPIRLGITFFITPKVSSLLKKFKGSH